jgi:hypothetical protein
VLDVFIREAFTAWALREPHAAAEGPVIGRGIGCIEAVDGEGAFDADEERWSRRGCGV